MPSERKVQYFHPNGVLRFESIFMEGQPTGTPREWHPNGVLALEQSVLNGKYDGLTQQWNDRGELLGSFEMKSGTGVFKDWHQNGQLISEITMVNGVFTGRQRCWFEDGELMGQLFWIRGRKVSKKKYLEACQSDDSLPRYDNEPKTKTWEEKMRRLEKARNAATPVVPDPTMVEAAQKQLEALLSDPTRREAGEWLRDPEAKGIRNLGEIPEGDGSIALVEEAYEAGAAKVFAVKIVKYEQHAETTGTLLVQLPPKGRKRKSALRWCNEQNGHQGFDPEDDAGQEWVTVQLD